jgi:hypothetical protein
VPEPAVEPWFGVNRRLATTIPFHGFSAIQLALNAVAILACAKTLGAIFGSRQKRCG